MKTFRRTGPQNAMKVQIIKGTLSGAPLLAHYDPEVLLILSRDASPIGVRAIC